MAGTGRFSKVHTGNFGRETLSEGYWGVKDEKKFKKFVYFTSSVKDSKKMKKFVYFKAGVKSKTGYQVSLLSNLAVGPQFEFNGLFYYSAEHAYMSVRVDAESRERFSINGDLGCFENMKNLNTMAWWNNLPFNKKASNLWCINGMDGQIATQATKYESCKMLGIKLVTQSINPNEEWELWNKILSAKFAANKNARDVLLASDNCLLIETARRQPGKSKWGGLVKDGVLLGKNTMGRYLCRVREMIINEESASDSKKHKSTEDSNDVIYISDSDYWGSVVN
jgi:hypothetical protein